MADPPLPGLLPNDPQNCLSEAARRRIYDARFEAEKIRTRTLATLEMRYRSEQKPVKPLSKYLSTGQAAIEFEQSTLEAARVVLLAMLKEFRAAGKSGRELHGIMAGELEAVVNSWELPTIQRDLLWLELDLSGIGSNQPARGKRTESTCGPEPSELLNREASSVQQRLCWWRDHENYGFDGFPEEKAANLEARYRYERAQAEVQFLTNCDGLKGVPLSGNENLIAFNLENYIGAFLHHSLYAFADFLLDKRMPGTKALRAFEQHANELLT